MLIDCTEEVSCAPTPMFHLYEQFIMTSDVCYNEAAASTAPAALNSFGLETTISTGYLHSINFAQPIIQVRTEIMMD